jgi:hypothetical protein
MLYDAMRWLNASYLRLFCVSDGFLNEGAGRSGARPGWKMHALDGGGAPVLLGDTYPDNGLDFNHLLKSPSRRHLVQYVDTEYGRNQSTGRSDEGQIIFLNSNTVSWSTRAQNMIAHSTHEAEITALSSGTRKLIKIRNYITGCGFDLDPTDLFEQNTAVSRYSRDIGLTRPSRSLNQHKHYGREQQHCDSINY